MDANYAGTAKSNQCTLLLCEGDSAKAGISGGLGASDRNTFGVFPLRGKLRNVRGESTNQALQNKEIGEIITIMGLESKRKYESMEDVKKYLRYGKILFLTDQDLDGSHIKGLIMNAISVLWPSLLKIPGFLGCMNTPIMKITKGKQERWFYNLREYEEWKKEVGETEYHKWTSKYYKGLGTSTSKEFRGYFQDPHEMHFTYTAELTSPEENQKMMNEYIQSIVSNTNDNEETSIVPQFQSPSDDALDLVFNKNRADDRKVMLEHYDRNNTLDTTMDKVPYETFVTKEMVHFCKYNCERSIPNLMDGLKVSQRKILYSAFARNLTKEIKVAQFSGYVSEKSAYHHGEQSLSGAIINLCQNFVGSNNIPLFKPCGQFGTRITGGSDAGSPRYIFTHLSPITMHLFPKDDMPLLEYLEDDGTPIEPVYYLPVFPLLLANGAQGIGTGFRCCLPNFCPIQIYNYLCNKLQKKDELNKDFKFIPHYRGFRGRVLEESSSKFIFCGCCERTGPTTIQITELPVGTWLDPYIQSLEKNGKTWIKDILNNSSDQVVNITIVSTKEELDKLEGNRLPDQYGITPIYHALSLTSKITTSYMYLFGHNEQLQKYETVGSIIDEYFVHRLALYKRRKQYLLDKYDHQQKVLQEKIRFIQGVMNGTYVLKGKTTHEIAEMLWNDGFGQIPSRGDDTNTKEEKIDEDDDHDNTTQTSSKIKCVRPLINMPMVNMSKDNVVKFQKENDHLSQMITDVQKTSTRLMWKRELDKVIECYREYCEEMEKEREASVGNGDGDGDLSNDVSSNKRKNNLVEKKSNSCINKKKKLSHPLIDN